MSSWGGLKGVVGVFPKKSTSGKRSSRRGNQAEVPGVERVTKELAQEAGRVPPEARADLAMIEVHLTRKTVPDEDPEQTLLKWLADRGFHDVLALRANANFEIIKREREGLDLCLWVDPERLLRASINKDPTKPPKPAKDLSNEERALLVQTATSVLAEAKENKILSYKKILLLHEQTTLGALRRLQSPYRMFWDRGEVLLDAIASYFGTKVGFYFAWLKFYTAALVFPTAFGIFVWWMERANSMADRSYGARETESVVGDILRATGVVVDPQRGVGGTPGGDGTGTGGRGGGFCLSVVGDAQSCDFSTSLAPYFNLFLAIWATLFLVLWKRRSSTLAFRWGVHREDTIERAKFMVGWKRPGRAGLTPAGILHRQQSFSSTSTSSTNTTMSLSSTGSTGSTGSVEGGDKTNGCGCALAREGLRRQCAQGLFRATAGQVASAAAAEAAAATDRKASAAAIGSNGDRWRVFSGSGGSDGRGMSAGERLGVREDGLEGGSWEPLRTARLFLSWLLEAGLLYLAIRMMLLFAWLEVRSLAKFGGGSVGVHAVRAASVVIPSTFYGAHWKWAKALASWEGHVTEAGAENSMTVKRFLFRFVNSFSRLFYLGFWQRDLVGLKEMLMTVLITRSFVDALQEVVAPMIQVQWKKRLRRATERREKNRGGVFVTHHHQQEQPKHVRRKRSWYQIATRQQQQHQQQQQQQQLESWEVSCRRGEIGSLLKKQRYREALMHERMLPEFHTQREYLDLIVQYGYVTMFAVALPLAPLLALVRCVAEIYIDHQKILGCRRPAYVDRSSIGAWYGVLELVGMASVLTNCILLALTAETRRLAVPAALATRYPHSKFLVMAVVAEHIILGVKMVVRVLIDDVPDGVERAMAEELLHEQEESRHKVELAVGFTQDIAPTHMTIVRKQQQQQQHPEEVTIDSSWHTTPSSVHMLSSSRTKAGTGAGEGAVGSRPKSQPTQRQQQQQQQQQQQSKPRRRFWSRQSSPPPALTPSSTTWTTLDGGRGGDLGDIPNTSRLSSLTLEGGNGHGRSGGRGGSPGGWSDVGPARGGQHVVREIDWGAASVDGDGGDNGIGGRSRRDLASTMASKRSVFSNSGAGPRQRGAHRRN